MPRRPRRRSSFVFWFAFIVIAASVCAGGVAAWVTHLNVGHANTNLPPIAPGGQTANARDLARLTRPQLESEVTRLNLEISDRNQQIDDLKIQLKLAAEGSHSAP